ncbi:MAG: MotE family protein [Brevundimonas sp.]|jgi:flagellar motility protein MotE (MotC chaperone)
MSKIPRLLPLIAVAIGGVVLVRAAGVAPGVFEGAQAWAQEAVPAGAAAAAPAAAAAICALTPEQLAQQAGISPAELRIMQSLSARRTELDARDADLASMLPLLATAEQKLDAKVAALEAVKAEVRVLLGQVSEQEKAENDRMVAVYSAMRPREAARVMATLDDDVRLPVAAAMRPRSLAAILAQMDPAEARSLTEKLARRFEARQQLAARAAAASATTGPAAGAAAPTAAPAAAAPAATPAATTRPNGETPAPAPAAAAPAPAPARANRPAARRPAARPAARTPAPAPAEPQGERPYAPAGPAPATPAPPRQSVE